jgi:integrase
MAHNPATKASGEGTSASTAITLQHLLDEMEGREALSVTRLRDMRSAVKRLAALLGEDPGRIPLNMSALSRKLAEVNPVAMGLTSKTFSNIKSDFIAAVKTAELTPLRHRTKAPLNAEWTSMLALLPGKRPRVGLSHLARYASALGIAPDEINDAIIETFIAEIRDGSLRRSSQNLHRMVSQVWNEVVRQLGLNLQPVTVPCFRRPPRRTEWMLLPKEFRTDVDQYLSWCAGADPFAADARSRVLAPGTCALRQNLVHTAVTALVESGVKPDAIRSMADLVSPENFKRILRRRHETVGNRQTATNRDLAEALVQIGHEWVKVDAGVLAELKRLTTKVPMPLSGLTAKNRRSLRQFDDLEVLRRLFNLPRRLWAELKRDQRWNRLTLAKAQAALAVAILSYMPLRLHNLTALAFDVHLFLREGARAISTLELTAAEVKNRRELAFDIPPHVAGMMIEYRDHIAPKVIGHRPKQLFVNIDGTPKGHDAVAELITRYLNKRAGIVLTPHQFRHLSAKVLLDAEPGSFETVRQLLGHANLNATVGAYAGIDSRRAARHHQTLVEETLAAEKPKPRRKTSTS